MRLDHVQVSCPPGGGDNARRFYAEAPGLSEVPKPPALARCGGVWFRSDGAEIHGGVEEPFRPARKAHPALRYDGDVVALAERVTRAGFPVHFDEDLPGYWRFYSEYGNGNRVEVLTPLPASRLG